MFLGFMIHEAKDEQVKENRVKENERASQAMRHDEFTTSQRYLVIVAHLAMSFLLFVFELTTDTTHATLQHPSNIHVVMIHLDRRG